MTYKVTAPYVTLRVPNELGQPVLAGFYAGAVLPEGVNRDDLDRHVRKGMVAEEGTPEAEAAVPGGQPVQFDAAGMPTAPAATTTAREGRPPVNAPKAEWVAYAVAQRDEGTPEDDARTAAESMSKADLIAKHGG